MMKKIKIALFLIFISLRLIAQEKSVIDTDMLGKWPSLMTWEGGIAMSNNGRYVAYIIVNQPIGAHTLVVEDLHTHWKKTIMSPYLEILFFSADSRKLYLKDRDSIWLQEVSADKEKRLIGVASEISYPKDAKGTWLALAGKNEKNFRLLDLTNGTERSLAAVKTHRWLAGGQALLLNTSIGDLQLMNLTNGKELLFIGVQDYSLSSDENSMVLLTQNGNRKRLQLSNFKKGTLLEIWTGPIADQPGGYIYDKSCHQLVFNVKSSDGKVSIWYYQVGKSKAVMEIEDQMTGLKDLDISGVTNISNNGRWLFFNVRKQMQILSSEDVKAPVDIWSYRDEVLNPAQSLKINNFYDYVAVVELGRKNVQLLEHGNDEKISTRAVGDYVLLEKGKNEAGLWWSHNGPRSHWIVSLEDGQRKLIKEYATELNGVKNSFLCDISPNGRWFWYWDFEKEHYFSWDSKTGKTINLSAGLPLKITDDIEQTVQTFPSGVVGWYANDSAVLVYDNYDIWKLDLSGEMNPINITNSYGRLHGIKLRLVYDLNNKIQGNEEFLLSGLDVKSKYNGFFKIRLDKPDSFQLLTMGPYNYYQMTVTKHNFTNFLQPITGGVGKNKRWIVTRESATEYPNFFVSKDLKEFKPITNLQPQKACNWLKVEPVSWRMYNGQLNTGVLYKPENFDPAKKYPIIFNYYEKFSHRCYQFPMPGLTRENINIPWFVSRGYMVFTPDIQYTVANKPGGMTISEAAYNSVASAAEYLSKRSYIDKNRMGIQGHSFGGHETNGIITYSNLFAAAAEMAGYSDHWSAYLTLVTGEENSSIEKYHKIDHPNQRMGATPWERPDLFRRNSPVQNADQVTTPLLITHNKQDGAVNFRQGLEMYMALRRLSKPCWLLQYDNSGHSLKGKRDPLDYTIRLEQYFDHYLKGEPAPQWMTMNTLAGYKNKNNLYELDPKGNCGKDCKVCKGWNEKEISREARDNKTNDEKQVSTKIK